jgi:hypothetical protein
MGFGKEDPCRIQPDHVLLCTTVLKDPAFDKYKNEWVIVESFSMDDAALAASYGFKKAITMHELCALYPTLCPVSIYDCL